MTDDSEYSLVVSFLIDTDGYSNRDREMFVCGVEFQMIYESIKNGLGWDQAIHTENESRVRVMCAKLGVAVSIKRSCDTWSLCKIPMTKE